LASSLTALFFSEHDLDFALHGGIDAGEPRVNIRRNCLWPPLGQGTGTSRG
jgi:hypothetical protein